MSNTATDELSGSRIRARQRKLLVILLAWLLITIVGLGLIGANQSRDSTYSRQGASVFDLGPINLAAPLVNGKSVTMAAAEDMAGFTIPMPNNASASSINLSRVLANSQHQVALVFDDGAVTVIVWPATYQDPESWFKTEVSEMGTGTILGQVNGEPASVTAADTDYTQANPAWVEFYLNGIDVNVVSYSYGTSTLLAIAGSMA